MTVDKRDIAKMVAEVEATSWRACATHRLEQMRRLLMLEEHKAWKREFGFDRIETAAEMDETRFRTSPVPAPLFYRNMSNPRRPHTPDEFTLEMKVDVERLRMEIIILQPASPQCVPLRRCAAVDTGSEGPGTPRRSPAIGTGSDEPGVSRVEISMEKKIILPLETSMDGFLHLQLHKPRAGVYYVPIRRRSRRQLRKYKPTLARSLRDCQLADSNERRLRPSKANCSTGGGKQ